MASELDALAATPEPATVQTLAADLVALGLEPGGVAIVHSSLSALGWVAGGAQAVVEALHRAVGPEGTLVMPTQSGQLSDPADWSDPPVPDAWIERLRNELPAFDPYLTPTRAMGQVVECFRQQRATLRSGHPTVSFAACGPQAEAIVGQHPLTPGLGDASPLGRLYDLDAEILLLGVGHGNNTSLHLAEHRASWPGKTDHREGAPIIENGQRVWVTYDDLELDEGDFPQIGDAFAAAGLEVAGPIGAATARRCRQSTLVDFAVEWMAANRGGGQDS